jgi:hypothetical protein
MDGIDPETWQLHAQTLQQALFQAPRFRKESDGKPLVYGYVRSAHRRPAYIAACKRALEQYCRRERLQLCTTFADQEVPGDTLVRGGLAGLLDVLRLPDSFAALVVSPYHLSDDANLADLLLKQVRATGARLLVVRPRPGRLPDAGADVDDADNQLREWWQ